MAVVDSLIIFFTSKIIPYLGFFPYGEYLLNYHLPKFISSLANFDGINYIIIASQRYYQYEQAFFPFYPMLIKILSPIFANNHLLTGLIISNLSFLLGLFIFVKYLEELLCHPELDSGSHLLKIRSRNEFGMTKKGFIFWTVVFFVTFPTSFFFGAVYTEGLFFFLAVSSLYFAKKERYMLAGIFAFLASLTRLLGVFLIIPFLFTLWPKRFKILKSYNPKVLLLLSPLLGFLTYSLYLFKTTGDPFFFLTAQPAFGAHRSAHLIFLPQVYFRYFKIFLTASHNFQYFISLFEFLVFNLVFFVVILNLFASLRSGIQDLIKIKQLPKPIFTKVTMGKQVRNDKKEFDYDRFGLGLFSLTNLVLPTLTGTFSSIPRYALLSLSFFIFMGEIKNTYLKVFFAVVFAVFHIVVLGYFAQGYFVS